MKNGEIACVVGRVISVEPPALAAASSFLPVTAERAGGKHVSGISATPRRGGRSGGQRHIPCRAAGQAGSRRRWLIGGHEALLKGKPESIAGACGSGREIRGVPRTINRLGRP